MQDYTCCGNGGNSDDLSLSQSGAVVNVYISNMLMQSFAVPAGAGSFWTVFELNGSTITRRGEEQIKEPLCSSRPAPPLLAAYGIHRYCSRPRSG